jgi:hypothetical protein
MNRPLEPLSNAVEVSFKEVFNPVLIMPFFEPELARQELSVVTGLRLDTIVYLAMPGALEPTLERTRVALVTDKGIVMVSRKNWHLVTPQSGVRVVIRVVPGKQALKTILQIVVTVLAYAIGSFIGGFIGSLVTAGLAIAGNLLINLLIPPVIAKKDEKGKPTFQISGFKNRFEPDGAVPMILGRMRTAPAFAATSWTEIVGDYQYIRSLFVFGQGHYSITDLKIGDTPLTKYSNIDYELRTGLAGDDLIKLYPNQVLEEAFNVEIAKLLPRDEFGDVTSGAAIDNPVSRFTASDCSRFGVVFFFPQGLGQYDDKGRILSRSMTVSIRYRRDGIGAWTVVPDTVFSAAKTEAFYRQLFYDLPVRGRYELELNTSTVESTSTQVIGRLMLAAVQSIRPEYPINYGKTLALLSVRVKATFQLNGALDNVNAIVQTFAYDYEVTTDTWVYRVTNNPAALYRHVLQTGSYPVDDTSIELNALARWHVFCAENALSYNFVHEDTASLQDVMMAVCAAGRATPRHDGIKWSIVVDGLNDLVDHINARNSRDFSWSRPYQLPPHAWRINFLDETNNFEPAERLVVRPGYTGPITVTEKLELPGKTHPDEIFIEGYRRFKELEYRPDTYTVVQDGHARVAVRGDRVKASFDVLDDMQMTGRVKAVNLAKLGTSHEIVIDNPFTAEPGVLYGVRFLSHAADVDGYVTSTQSVVTPVLTLPALSDVIVIPSYSAVPRVGEILHIGPMNSTEYDLVVHQVEPGENQSSVITLLDYAPKIDRDVAAVQIPVWSPRVGTDIGGSTLLPDAPVYVSIRSGLTATGAANGLEVHLRANPASPVLLRSFIIGHRLTSGGAWQEVTIPVAAAGTKITSYTAGDSVTLRCRAVSVDGNEGPSNSTQVIVIGARDATAPSALLDVSVAGGLGFVFITAGTQANTDEIRIYSKTSTGGILNQAVDLKDTYAAPRATTYQMTIGDATRLNLLQNASFDIDANWTKGAGWAIASGVATHAPGTASNLSQNEPLVAGKTYRTAFTTSGGTAGEIQINFSGGTVVSGAVRTGNGRWLEKLTAVTGNSGFYFSSSTIFDGSLDDAVLFEETPLCLDQGIHSVWIQPFNDGIAGPLAGPFVVTVI